MHRSTPCGIRSARSKGDPSAGLNSYGTRCEVGFNSVHTVMVNGKDRDITDADLIIAATCGVPESKLRAIFSEIEEEFQEKFEHFYINQFAILRNGGILV